MDFSLAPEHVREELNRVWQTIKEVFWGMFFYDMVDTLRKERAQSENLFVLIVFGDIIGVPILPPYYTLRLLPYIIPEINRWKRYMLRERDLTDLAG